MDLWESIKDLFELANHIAVAIIRYRNKHMPVSVNTGRTPNKNYLKASFDISCLNNSSEDIFIVFKGLSLVSPSVNDYCEPLDILSHDYEEKVLDMYTIKSNNSLSVKIPIKALVDSFFNTSYKITSINDMYNIGNINNLNERDIDFIFAQLANNKPIYLWPSFDVYRERSNRRKNRDGILCISPSDLFYRPFKRYCMYKYGYEIGMRLMGYVKKFSKAVFCQRVLDSPDLCKAEIQKGFLDGCKRKKLNGDLYLSLAKKYQENDDDSLYQLGFRICFTNPSADEKASNYSGFSSFKLAFNNVKQIIDHYNN